MLEFIILGVICALIFIVVFKWFDFECVGILPSASLAVMMIILIVLLSILVPQHQIKTELDIKYESINISDDNLNLFIVTNKSKEVVTNFEIVITDDETKVGKLIKITTISDESKFPNNILVSDFTTINTEKYVYYMKLK